VVVVVVDDVVVVVIDGVVVPVVDDVDDTAESESVVARIVLE